MQLVHAPPPPPHYSLACHINWYAVWSQHSHLHYDYRDQRVLQGFEKTSGLDISTLIPPITPSCNDLT